MRGFESHVVRWKSIHFCHTCGEQIRDGEIVTAPVRMPFPLSPTIQFCGDCLLAAMMSRLEVVVDGIEARIEEREKLSLDTSKERV